VTRIRFSNESALNVTDFEVNDVDYSKIYKNSKSPNNKTELNGAIKSFLEMSSHNMDDKNKKKVENAKAKVNKKMKKNEKENVPSKAVIKSKNDSENKEKVLHKVIPTKNFIKSKKAKTIEDLNKETIKYKTPQIQNNVFKKNHLWN
jgi:hypothetical protein